MLLSATNIVKAKLINIWVVFEAIRIQGPISRSGIAEATGLSKQATSELVDELLSLHFVREEKTSGRGVGKPPTPLTINPGGAFTLGFHVDFGQVASVAINLAGEVLARDDHELQDLTPDRAAADIAHAATQLLQTTKIPRERLLGIGLATPGPFAVAGLSPPRLPGWDGVELRKLLRDATGLGVSLANDGQCAVTAEWRFGEVARRLTNFVYVYIGMGLGSGVMIQGAAFGGASGNAGEFGHTTVVPGGHGCICGKNGCLETYLSVDSAMRHLAANGIEVDSMSAFEERFDAAHPAVAAWIGEAIEPLRIGLNTIENLFDPQTIMLGGTAPAWLIDALVEDVQPLYPSVGRHNREIPRLIRAELGRDSVARGAAVLPVLSRLNPQYQQLNPFG
ncbi:ROK family transcriptional regulator [Dongia sedimenti]|uniref:ROK family transcriptional regulator n=1 Tax=Dongia sedimenti TaxID=3064282 RepID=A0ABU0YWI5_9PROT|nr:ROK family transcriptional regulator [Rhodospirillaceae bacterium R-7]